MLYSTRLYHIKLYYIMINTMEYVLKSYRAWVTIELGFGACLHKNNSHLKPYKSYTLNSINPIT